MGICSSKTSVADGKLLTGVEHHIQTKQLLQKSMAITHKHSSVEEGDAFMKSFPISSVEHIKTIYTIDTKVLGQGKYSKVRIGYLRKDAKQKFAIKSIKKKDHDYKLRAYLKRELRMLRSLDHSNIAFFFESYNEDNHLHLVIEYCDGGSLADLIKKQNLLTENVAKVLMFQMLLAVNYLHAMKICHRDLKTQNFILTNIAKDATIKLIDFGLSNSMMGVSELVSPVGTPLYVSPELLQGSYDLKTDCWSMGVVLYNMLSGKFPFQAKTEGDLLETISKGEYNISKGFWTSVSEDAKTVIRGLLTYEPNQRMSIADALRSRWFEDVDKEMNEIGKNALTQDRIDRIINFKKVGKFKCRVLILMVQICDYNDEVPDLRHAFFYLDYLNNGLIHEEELALFFKEHDIQISEDEVKKIIISISLKTKGAITYIEFLAATIDPVYLLRDENLSLAFQRFDLDDSGTISKENLKNCFIRFGYELKDSDIAEMINEVDHDENGKISKEMFVQYMKNEK